MAIEVFNDKRQLHYHNERHSHQLEQMITPDNIDELNWWPIEMAPKDGTRVLLYSPPGNRPVGREVFEGYFGSNSEVDFPTWTKCESHYSVQPTRWMPLPTFLEEPTK